jgi:hypothetical protein
MTDSTPLQPDCCPRGVKLRDLPKLIPWNGFDLSQPNQLTDACREIAVILADDQWHATKEVVGIVAATCLDLQPQTIERLIRDLVAHGDIRRHGSRKGMLRLTTRWRDQ